MKNKDNLTNEQIVDIALAFDDSNPNNFGDYLIYGISDGDNLYGMEFDINAYVCAIGDSFDFISQERTDNKNCMLILHCQTDKYNFEQVADILKKKWLSSICYKEFEKHHIEITDSSVTLHYVTRTSTGLGVTGKIVVKCV